MKMKPKVKKVSTLSDKIADALTVKPRADIEDDQIFGTKPQIVSRTDFSSSDSEDDAAISDFHKRNVNLLSEVSKKYEGQIISRKDLDESGSDVSYEHSDSDRDIDQFSTLKKSINNEDDSSDNETETKELSPKKFNKTESVSGTESSADDEAESDDYSITRAPKADSSESEQSEQSDDDGEGYDISQMDQPVKEDFEHVKKQNVSEEAKKGACVRNQLLVWEGLLEMRIHLQRCMNTANQMPMPDTYQELKKNDEFVENCNLAKLNISNVLDKFLTLQNLLLKNYPETKALFTKKKEAESKVESDEEIPSDTDNEDIPSDTDAEEVKETKSPIKTVKHNTGPKKRKLEDYEREISTSYKAFKSFRDNTIQKWNDKTRLATATNIKSAPTNTVLQQISYILSDREKLTKRTQLKRSEYDIIGYKKPLDKDKDTDASLMTKDRKEDDEYIPEIFDDSDFYHQQLRELIECKSADISDPVQLSRQWIALQQMRSKMKRKVDTKATKGRKIKYVVHNKLVNYMAPEKNTTWNDESTNELYSSLFGKMYENNDVGVNMFTENGFKLNK